MLIYIITKQANEGFHSIYFQIMESIFYGVFYYFADLPYTSL